MAWEIMDEIRGIWDVPLQLTATLGAQPSLGSVGCLQTLTAPAWFFVLSRRSPFYMRIRDDGALGALADADGAGGRWGHTSI